MRNSKELGENLKSSLISGVEINQVEIHSLQKHYDVRGSFTETFQNNWHSLLNPVQWSVVQSKKKVFRGMHYHSRHDEYFCLISGHALLGLKDLRTASPTYGEYALYELIDIDPCAVIFPKGLLHGWYFCRDSVHLQSVSETYSSYSKDDNHICYWGANDIGIPWPMDDVILSERASSSSAFSSQANLISYLEKKATLII